MFGPKLLWFHVKHQWPLSAVVRLQCSGVQEVTANGKAQMEPETPHRRLFGGQLSWVQTASTESSGTSTISSVSRASRDTNMSASQTSTRASLQCVNLTVQCNKVNKQCCVCMVVYDLVSDLGWNVTWSNGFQLLVNS